LLELTPKRGLGLLFPSPDFGVQITEGPFFYDLLEVDV